MRQVLLTLASTVLLLCISELDIAVIVRGTGFETVKSMKHDMKSCFWPHGIIFAMFHGSMRLCIACYDDHYIVDLSRLLVEVR